MAPRVTKKSNHSASSLTSSRQGLHRTRKEALREVEESGQTDHASDDMDIDSNEVSHTEEAESASSRGAPEDALELLIGNVVDEQRKRETDRKKYVTASYSKSFQAAHNSINGYFNEYEEKASLAHQAQLKRLQELLVHKIKIEAAMAKELASLRTGYEAHAKDLQTCINRRTKELM